MNNRPRATHAWHSPLEVFARTLASAHQPPASIRWRNPVALQTWNRRAL